MSIFIIVFYHIMTCMNTMLLMCVRVIDFDTILMTFRFYFRTVLEVWYVLFFSISSVCLSSGDDFICLHICISLIRTHD
jgi:hypothetical protein